MGAVGKFISKVNGYTKKLGIVGNLLNPGAAVNHALGLPDPIEDAEYVLEGKDPFAWQATQLQEEFGAMAAPPAVTAPRTPDTAYESRQNIARQTFVRNTLGETTNTTKRKTLGE